MYNRDTPLALQLNARRVPSGDHDGFHAWCPSGSWVPSDRTRAIVHSVNPNGIVQRVKHQMPAVGRPARDERVMPKIGDERMLA